MNFDTIGVLILGSRLSALSDMMTKDAALIYKRYDIDLKPKWFPVFYMLSTHLEGMSVTVIAQEINHSHPSVIKIIREMVKSGIVSERKDANDGRKTIVFLTAKGKLVSEKIKDQYTDVTAAVQNMLGLTTHNLWKATQEFEYLLADKSLYDRVVEAQKSRISAEIQIINYLPEHHHAFKRLNESWIKHYFKIETADSNALDHPDKYILENGGHILVAMLNNKVLGVCALIKMEHSKYGYELAKMAVAEKAKGKGIGYLLGTSIIAKAKKLGANYIYLESNTILQPAIALYKKLGFQKVVGEYSPYERCNIQMELKIK